jgi:glycosyltransferase involved in cell wall biosynthesis
LRASGKRVARIYTPHGGSLHFDAASLRGRVYFAAERALGALTDGFVFVSRFEADTFAEKVGKTKKPSAIVYNGLRPEEFAPVAPADDASDFLFIGELRDLKGPDVFLNALAAIGAGGGRPPSAAVVGDGPDRERVRALAVELGLAGSVAFLAPMPARAAFRLARCLVVPSRKESLPYIVLEAAAAAMPAIATRVGGIPEIFGDEAAALVPPGDVAALADAMQRALSEPDAATARALRLQARVRTRFSTAAMAEGIDALYAEAAGR